MKLISILLFLPAFLHAQTFTAKTGKWSAASTWKGGKVPANSAVVISTGHTVTLDINVKVKGLLISKAAGLVFDNKKNCTLTTTKNIVDSGRLVSNPNPDIFHTIIIDSVEESKFIGGGMGVITQDVGLWVRGAGTLELKGAPKTAWCNLSGEVLHGATTIKLKIIPKGWRVGDEISIAPTTSIVNKTFVTGFDLVTIKSISGSTVTLNTPLIYDHPTVINPFGAVITAEVMNLTRNIRIEGRVKGRSHINIAMTSGKFNISNIQIRYMGVRSDTATLGRYPLHFHHCGNNTAGSLIEGLVIRDCDNHAYVPHASHGITFKNCIAYNITEPAYWWDPPPNDGVDPVNNSNDIVFDSCISAVVKVGNSQYRLSNYFLGSGLRNTVKNSIAIGNQGGPASAGYMWPESSNYTENLWVFENNIAHNNKYDGIFTWQNDPNPHTIHGFLAYNNGNHGIEHGAYTNNYKYIKCDLFSNKNGVLIHANARPKGAKDQYGYLMSFVNVRSTDPLYVTTHTLPGGGPILFKDCRFPGVIINELPKRVTTPCPGSFDFLNSNLLPQNFSIIGMEPGSIINVQNTDGNNFKINDKGIMSNISSFFIW